MDSPAYSLPVMSGITQLSPTPSSVITLGHTSNVPLIQPPSELVDRSEPHDTILLRGHDRGDGTHEHGYREGCTRGCGLGGYLEGGIPSTVSEAKPVVI